MILIETQSGGTAAAAIGRLPIPSTEIERPMKLSLIAMALAVAMPAFAQSSPPGPPPDMQGRRAEHAQFEAAWAQCKAIADGSARADCFEKVHDDAEAAMARHAAERRGPPPQ
jgi:hypothetical protein